jgi:hypothetical protein
MGVGTYYFYYGYGLKAFEGRHIRISILIFRFWAYLMKVIPETYLMKVIPETYLMKVIPETRRVH